MTEAGAHDAFPAAEGVSKADAWLHIAEIRGTEFPDNPNFAGRWHEVNIVAQSKSEREIGADLPGILAVERKQLVPKIQVRAACKIRRGWPGVNAGLKWQRTLRNVHAEIIARFEEEELDGRAGTVWAARRTAKWPNAEEALRGENAETGTHKSGLRADPDRLEIAAEAEAVIAVNVR